MSASAARFPGVPLRRGHYESYYLKACHPDGGLAAWIRYTVHKRPGAEPQGFVWFTLFDAERGVRAAKVRTPPPSVGPGVYMRFGDCLCAPDRLAGAAASEHAQASWNLRLNGHEAPLMHFPMPVMYRAPLPRTKVCSPQPDVSVTGTVQIDGRRIEVDGWRGTLGHNWGSEHAWRAIWLHGTNFAGHPDAWIDLAIGRVKLGPLITPWVANGALMLDGRRYRLGDARHQRATRIDETPEHCRFEVAGPGVSVHGEAGAPVQRFVGWLYAQPSGPERQTVNCSIADMAIEVLRPGGTPLRLEVAAGAAYELQMAERYPAIAVQPFSDG